MNLTDLLAMPLIHTHQARALGTVVGFALQELTVTHYLVVDETYADEQAFSFDEVYVGQDALCTLSNPQTPPAVRVPFRCHVYTADGTMLGYLDEVKVSKSGKIESILVSGQSIGAAKLAALNDVVVVKGRDVKGTRVPTAPTIGTKRGRPRKTESASAPMDDGAPRAQENDDETSQAASTPPTAERDSEGLKRIISNYSFLLGRILQEDLMAGDSVLLAKGTVLHDKEVATAWRRGLLVTLTQLSRA